MECVIKTALITKNTIEKNESLSNQEEVYMSAEKENIINLLRSSGIMCPDGCRCKNSEFRQ